MKNEDRKAKYGNIYGFNGKMLMQIEKSKINIKTIGLKPCI